MKNPRQNQLPYELAFYGYEATSELRQAELRQWTLYLPDLLPSLLQSIDKD
ncbi:hypothetical protein [Vogesella alkaliphila]|uniref:Uncharacterized protein n=1 Tax=Vogesella alkaliphila TaxID=1193621 RepID=A0ABQ2YNT0_9NEIS|nr:hypothetical protein [Vogesella alkaliphila]GGX90460.1 hypothetical protein GCM10011290_17720 [Vogesella alkaliphila]